MSHLKHTSIVITALPEALLKIRQKALIIFSKEVSAYASIIGDITLSPEKTYGTLTIGSDGYYKGSLDSRELKELRNIFMDWLDENYILYSCNYIAISYGGDDNSIKIIRQSK
jgi:hypothetical protein